MQNAGPASPRLRRPALAGLALTLLAATFPAAADEPVPSVPPAPAPGLAELRAARPAARANWPVWPTAIAFGRLRGGHGAGPVGLAFRLAEGLSLSAGGSFDPASGETLGMVSLDIRF